MRALIDRALRLDFNVSLLYEPLCVLADEKYAELCNKWRDRADKFSDVFYDPFVEDIAGIAMAELPQAMKSEKCKMCRYDSVCDGVWYNYGTYYGLEELNPFA